MSFSMPKNLPSFANPNRSTEDAYWGVGGGINSRGGGLGKRTGLDNGSSSSSGGGLVGEVGSFFTGGGSRSPALPMYKDKPYSYATSRRVTPLWIRIRAMVILMAVALTILYLLGVFGWERNGGDDDDGNSSYVRWSSWSSSLNNNGKADWDSKREKVVEAFELSWDAYSNYAWGYDVYHPVSKKGDQMAPKGMGWIIIDSLDTMILMNLTTRLAHARQWLDNSLTWDQDQDVSMFETTIRMLGGLLSAHYLSAEYPQLAPIADDDPGSPGEDLYLEKARDLADRLISGFDSESGVPYASVHLGDMRGIPSHADGGASSTAEATTLQLEFKYMAKLTGEREFWGTAEKVMEVVDNNGAQDGLVPIFILPRTGEFRGSNIRLGSRGDSYYEYLIKQYLQTSGEEPVYREMWDEALAGVRKHLVTYTPSGFTLIGERPSGLTSPLLPKMDHLVCFMPGTIALAATGGLTEAEARTRPSWSAQSEADMRLARELMHTCWATYKWMATGLAAEITHFNLPNPPLFEADPHPSPPETLDDDEDPKALEWRRDFTVKSNDVHNLQRPETVESLFYMWRITGDTKYREWGWEMFKSFMEHTAVPDDGGFTSLKNANVVPPVMADNMESFWMAETLKYFYLLFSPNDLLPLDKVVFNTEAHPFPTFSMGPLFSTGWKRLPRDESGKIIKRTEAEG